MIIDRLLQVSDKQEVFTSAPSTDVIDFGQKNPNTGMDERTKMVVTMPEPYVGSGTFTFDVQDSDDNANWSVAASSGPVDAAFMSQHKQVVIAMPTRLRRYCRLYYTLNFTGAIGKFSAQIVTGIQQNDPYPDSPNIS